MSAYLAGWRTRAENYYLSLPNRDRLALIVLALFLLGVMIYALLLAPAYQYHAQARNAFEQQRELHQWLQAQKSAVENLPGVANGGAPQAGASSLTLVNSSAVQFKLTIKRVQPESNGDLRVWMEEVDFDGALKWLHHLQSSGMTIGELNLDKSSPGKVNLRATFTS